MTFIVSVSWCQAANSTIGGNVRVGTDSASGAFSVIRGNLDAGGDVGLGAGSVVLGSNHRGPPNPLRTQRRLIALISAMV